MKLLVTGSSGLIGSEAVVYFEARGHEVVGVDNNMRAVFFGPKGDTSWNTARLQEQTRRFRHVPLDIRDREGVLQLFERERFDAVIHAAAQPSHDRAAQIPFLDFEVNALGTLNLLEANRQFSLEAPFVHLSTNKVYGDAPNELALVETETRYDYADPAYANGIPETLRIDHSKHSLFGASKVAADVMVQEYGRYFGMPTVCLRGGCLTGPSHSGVELHGFLSYLLKCNVEEAPYTVFGYKAKQVRDNIHAHDVARFVEQFLEAPRVAAVYNLGGGKGNAVSMMEAFARAEALTGKPMRWTYTEQAREGDHICYYSDLSRMQADYPGWSITKDLDAIFEEIVESWERRLHAAA
ncbi:MAG TPA: NAD-dependent epimerase/dehydratase family protein [Rubricoccaceae bacterium]|nr:NAD-dependent epimerase/dehydratase family protein [Rubricoccaceae bacterium]